MGRGFGFNNDWIWWIIIIILVLGLLDDDRCDHHRPC